MFSVAAYYLRAKANSQIAMVNILREMLISEGRDKDFLLDNISKLMKGIYNNSICSPILSTYYIDR